LADVRKAGLRESLLSAAALKVLLPAYFRNPFRTRSVSRKGNGMTAPAPLPEEPGPLDSNDVRAWRTYADSLRARLQEEIAKYENALQINDSIVQTLNGEREMRMESESRAAALQKDIERAASLLGVPDSRSKYLAGKVDVCLTRMQREIDTEREARAALQKELEAVRKDVENMDWFEEDVTRLDEVWEVMHQFNSVREAIDAVRAALSKESK
jgi:hypothetical protein